MTAVKSIFTRKIEEENFVYIEALLVVKTIQRGEIGLFSY